MSVRRGWIELDVGRQAGGLGLSVSRQCELAGVSRSWVYAPAAAEVDALDLTLLRLIDAQYTRRPCFGSRRMVIPVLEHLSDIDCRVPSCKRVTLATYQHRRGAGCGKARPHF